MIQNVVDANRERTLFLFDGTHVYCVPQDWCDGWSVADGFTGGLDYVNDEGEAEPEIYCYAPVDTKPNCEIDTVFVAVKTLQSMEEIDEQRAKEIHPAMFESFDRINKE